MRKDQRNELLDILRDTVLEFESKKDQFISNPKLIHCFIRGEYALAGSSRDSGSRTIALGYCFHHGLLVQTIGNTLRDSQVMERLYNFVNRYNLWHTKYETFEDSCRFLPNLSTQIAGGFLSRNFELNDNQFSVSEDSFHQAANELISFFTKDYIEIDIFTNIYGLRGMTEKIILSKEASIIKADHNLAKLFSLYYTVSGQGIQEMIQGDYVLKIKHRFPKNYYNSSNLQLLRKSQDELVNKWSHLPILALGGLIQLNRRLNISLDWPLHRISLGSHTSEPYQHTYKKDLTTNIEESLTSLKKVTNLLNAVGYKKLDDRIIASISRLKRSKAESDINNRIVELAIAFEYLIKTSTRDVNLTLKLKAIRLLTDKNLDHEIFKKIGDFYGYRSDIIHGKTARVKATKEIVDYVELLVQKLICKYLEHHKYSYDEVDRALSKALYINLPLKTLLSESH